MKAGGILVPDPATVHCGQRYDLKAKLPGGRKLWGKNSKGDVKNLFWTRKIWPVTTLSLADLRVLFTSVAEKSREDLATVAAVFTEGEGVRRSITTSIHAYSGTHEC